MIEDLDLKHDFALTFAEHMTNSASLEELKMYYHDYIYEDVMDNWTLQELEEELRSLDSE